MYTADCEGWLLIREGQHSKDISIPSGLPFLNKNGATEKSKEDYTVQEIFTMGYLMLSLC